MTRRGSERAAAYPPREALATRGSAAETDFDEEGPTSLEPARVEAAEPVESVEPVQVMSAPPPSAHESDAVVLPMLVPRRALAVVAALGVAGALFGLWLALR